MESVLIRLGDLNDIKEFVSDVETIDGCVNIRVGKIEISAKSIMNIFTLNLTQDINVVYHGEDVDKFRETIYKYMLCE